MTKRKISKERHCATAVWVALIVVFMAELLVYSWCRIQYVQIGYEIAEARQEHQRLTAVHDELRIEEARLRSPERVGRIARERGLVMPDPGQVVVMP
ncbi:MAG: cell division protein FtsL [Desulfobacterales bacterium]|nr:cell division protein FtsL [Desulfobacterales bacterium]